MYNPRFQRLGNKENIIYVKCSEYTQPVRDSLCVYIQPDLIKNLFTKYFSQFADLITITLF